MFALLVTPYGWQIIKTEGTKATIVAAFGADETLATRTVELLNRHGTEDVAVPVDLLAQLQGGRHHSPLPVRNGEGHDTEGVP